MSETTGENSINKDKWLDDTHYDAIIVGTGLTESILAGAIGRIGKRVLHFDKNDFYGNHTGTFNLRQFEEILSNNKSSAPIKSEDTLYIHNTPSGVELSNCESEAFKIYPAISDTNEQGSTSADVVDERTPLEAVLAESRNYNVDIVPKYFFGVGSEVDLLISSGVTQYLEYKTVDGIYALTPDNGLQIVPSSKSDVFKSKYIGLLEKRHLNKFLGTIAKELGTVEESEESTESNNNNNENQVKIQGDLPFIEFVQSQGLNVKLQSLILYSIALLEDDQSKIESREQLASTTQALSTMRQYVHSIGKYGATPFLAQMYGFSELCQAFCRLCAVYGGLYILRRTVRQLTIEDSQYKGIVDSEGQPLTSDFFIASSLYFPNLLNRDNQQWVSRCVAITQSTLMPSNPDQHQLFIVVPPGCCGNKHAVHVYQFSSTLYTAPKGKYLVHFVTKANGSARADLEQTVNTLLHKSTEEEPTHASKPTMLYRAFFNIPMRRLLKNCDEIVPKNFFLCEDSAVALDNRVAIERARSIFHRIYPDEPFLPKIPNPDHVVWEQEGESEETKQES